jgi:hypothetical protein
MYAELYIKYLKIMFISFAVFSSFIFPREKNTSWKVIVNKISESSGNNYEYKLLIDVFNDEGEKVYTISKFIPYDMPFPATSVFKAGELMVVYSYNGIIEFYNSSGQLVNKIVTNLTEDVENDRVIKFQTVNDQSALLISEPRLYQTKLLIVSSDGKIQLKKEIDGNHATGIDLSGTGEMIAAGTYTWIDTSFYEQTTFLNSEGDYIGHLKLSFTNGMFTSDEKEFLGFTNSNIFYAEVSPSRLNWSYEFPSDISVTDATILNDKIYVLSSDLPVMKLGKWLYPNLVLNTFNASGKLIQRMKVDSEPVESALIVINSNQINLNLDGNMVPVNKSN